MKIKLMLSEYHKKQKALAKERLAKQAEFKEFELREVFSRVIPAPIFVIPAKPALDRDRGAGIQAMKIAVLGCAHKGLIKVHEYIFKKLLKKPIKLTTFDIVIEHLKGGKNVIQHDCTKPLPGGPYDITYGHVVLKFIETAKQWNFIKNSYDALAPGGLAIHIMNEEEWKTKSKKLPDGYNSVPLARWEKKMKEEKIKYKKILIKIKKLRGLALVLIK